LSPLQARREGATNIIIPDRTISYPVFFFLTTLPTYLQYICILTHRKMNANNAIKEVDHRAAFLQTSLQQPWPTAVEMIGPCLRPIPQPMYVCSMYSIKCRPSSPLLYLLQWFRRRQIRRSLLLTQQRTSKKERKTASAFAVLTRRRSCVC